MAQAWVDLSAASLQAIVWHTIEWARSEAKIMQESLSPLVIDFQFVQTLETSARNLGKLQRVAARRNCNSSSLLIEKTKWWASHVHLIGSHLVNECFSNVSSGVPLSVEANEKRFGDLTQSHLLACSRIKTIFRESKAKENELRKKISQNYVTSLFWAFFSGGVVRMLCQVVIHTAATVARKLCTMTRQIADTTATIALKERVRKRNQREEKKSQQ